ncbi:Do family serine endopeptidase [Sphingomonas glaciei]|uniref:Do family serine endopeptidase n=1 Tax=Sphingomonas glaciei TaxID=2938948 RepID=A0ABY5MUR6_9SPHN|nr:Do family serine endopeptidase [Sphingomonas glaciei]UUR07724.1 Do family serine endopeptidase [Sphingomonas glaciei]
MRYAYGLAAALLIGGSAFSIATGPVGAQVAQNAPAALPPRGAPGSFADLAARLQPAVVNIQTKQRVPVRQGQTDPLAEFLRRFGQPGQGGGQGQGQGQAPQSRESGSLGSGFIISADGYVVTNNHLIQGAGGTGTVDSVTVILTDRRELPARIIGRDAASDLALLKIEGSNFPFVNWGDSNRARVGDWVMAIGNPYGLGGTVTAGIISALHRGITGAGAYDRYIQTDASINMGNSGGPMFDLNGNVIGVNSALISPTGASVGIGLAIPAELARPVIDSLRRGQRPQRGYLGISLLPIGESEAAALGIPRNQGELVRSVVPGQPAARAGIQQGDVIVRVSGREVTPDETASYLISLVTPGQRVPIEVVRDGRRTTINATVAQRPTDEELARISGGTPEGQAFDPNDQNAPAVPAGQALGLSLQPLTADIARAINVPADTRGLVVTNVDANSDAAEKGLRRGDVILSVNRQAVTSTAQVGAAVEAARRAGRTAVLLLVKRGQAPEGFIGVDIAR